MDPKDKDGASPTVSKKSAYNAGDAGDASSILGSGRSSGEGHGKLFQYSFWENPMDKEV